jgi:hypothetical protein
MTEGPTLETKIATLTKRIDDQARFTRAVTVVCTTALLGVMFYMLTEIFTTLPAVMVTSFLGQMDTVQSMWKATELHKSRRAAPAAETTAPAEK